jgi:hypothetical protein
MRVSKGYAYIVLKRMVIILKVLYNIGIKYRIFVEFCVPSVINHVLTTVF